MITVSVNINKLVKNIRTISKLCKHSGCTLIFSIKGFLGNQKILRRIFQEKDSPAIVGDSRELSFKNNIGLFKNKAKILISVPAYQNEQKANDILSYADVCYISTVDHVNLLESIAKKKRKIYQVIIMIDSGDNREGIALNDKDSLDRICKSIKISKHLKLVGISTNIGCLSNAAPSLKMLRSFSRVVKSIQYTYKIDMKHVIGGSSNLLPLLQRQKLPSAINSICVGEAILLGTIPGFRRNTLGLETDIFSISIDICEIKRLNKNNYQCLLLIGKNDIDQNDIIWPKHIKFVNYSSDYAVIRTNAKGFKKCNLKRGTVKLDVKYYALPRLLSSANVNICFTK